MAHTDRKTTGLSTTTRQRKGAPPGNQFAKGHGAPEGNCNGRGNLRHGLRTGRLPRELQYYDQRMDDFRRKLENLVIEVRGHVDPKTAFHIVAIGYRFREQLLRARHLRKLFSEGKEGTAEWFEFVEKIAISAERAADRVAKLPLDCDARENIVDALYAREVPALTNNENT